MTNKIKNKYILVLGFAVAAMLTACGGGTPNSNNGNSTKNANAAAKGAGIPATAPAGAIPPTQAGGQNTAVTIEEFADFQCPQCGAKNPVFNEIRSLYGSRIKFIYRSFPLDIAAHDKAYDAAVAAQAAWMQGKFWEFENLLYSNQQAWSADPNYKQVWKGYAQQVGLDVTKWENDCLGLPAKQRVDDDKKRATSIPVGSTPTVYINDREVPFAQMTVEGLKSIIDAELAKAPPASGQPAAPAPNAANTTPAANTAGSSNAANGAKK